MKKPLKDVSGTTLALTSLAVLGVAAVVSTPMWLWHRRKRKRIDSLAGTPPEQPPKAEPDAPGDQAPTEPPPEEPRGE